MAIAAKIKSKLIPYRIKFIKDSKLFDILWYQKKSSKTFDSIDAAIHHYLRIGQAQNYDPNPVFSVAFYKGASSDIVAANADPLTHFLTFGAKEGRNPHPLFDVVYYLENNPDVAKAGINPLTHFLMHGGLEGRDPHPLFRSQHYLDTYTDVAAAKINPLVHYLYSGANEGRDPHPLFRTRDYLAQNPDVREAGINPLVHYLIFGGFEGRKPHPLFDSAYYLKENKSVADSHVNPLLHFVSQKDYGFANPNPLFDSAYYLDRLDRSSDFANNPLEDYIKFGWIEGKNPHPLFDASFYLSEYPDISAANVIPLEHYLGSGFSEGRKPNKIFDPEYYRASYLSARTDINPLVHYIDEGAGKGYFPAPDFSSLAAALNTEAGTSLLGALLEQLHDNGLSVSDEKIGYVPPQGLLPWFNPLNVMTVSAFNLRPRLNVLLPWIAMKAMSGGPNTVLNFVFRLASHGIPIRLVSTDLVPDADHEPIFAHCRALAGLSSEQAVDVEIVDGSNRLSPLRIGENDVFFATAWWTAQMAHYAVKKTRLKKFIYFVQDYEPVLHEGSTKKALAIDTYNFDMIPIFNTSLLRDYFIKNNIGSIGNRPASEILYFEPAIDTTKFYHPGLLKERKKRLLFYARPTSAYRNLFELGLAALQKIVSDGVIDPAEWEFVGMGEPFDPIDIGAGAQLTAAPWLGFDEYARLMRESSVLLSLMQSPHPSYPPIEFAACGKPVVTSAFENKTAAALAEISPNILGAHESIEELAKALCIAIGRTYVGEKPQTTIAYPRSWGESFKDLVPRAVEMLKEMLGLVRLPDGVALLRPSQSAFVPGFDAWPTNEYGMRRVLALQSRLEQYLPADASIFSFLTTVWDTHPDYLYDLAETVFSQNSGTDFEWIILDNGSRNAATKAALAAIAKHPSVRLLKVRDNLGIIGGMDYVLKRATRKYVLPLDSDDLLTPDCLSVFSNALAAAGYPALAYSDEDKIMGRDFRDPYFKPDWDPVLFYHSCYIAHLCAIDRELLLKLGGYTDGNSTGCHDWDTFTRFNIAGYTPVHVPEVLYTWRMHEMSTAVNINSKDYISASHINVLSKYVESRVDAEHIEIEYSPIFNQTPDWRYVYKLANSKPIITAILGGADSAKQIWTVNELETHEVRHVADTVDWQSLRKIAEDAARKGAVVHLLARDVEIDDPLWFEEAISLMHMFPDAGVVGGRIHSGSLIRAADIYFDVCDGVVSPNVGRNIQDPGYFAQAWKPHSCDAVPVYHCVVRPDILLATVNAVDGVDVSWEGFGLWLGRIAQKMSARVVYSPFVSARAPRRSESGLSPMERNAQLILMEDFASRTAKWPHMLGRSANNAYSQISADQKRRERLALASATSRAKCDIEAAYLARRISREGSAKGLTVSVLTSVWERTPVDLFKLTAQSLMEQDRPFTEWVLLENGPISDDLARVLSELQADRRVKRLKVAKNLGILKAMRCCLEHATGDMVMPMDADDLVVRDAIACLVEQAKAGAADFVFSDEAMLVNGTVVSPYLRGGFDEILNLNDSYIWHLCAFKREMALTLGVYTEIKAEYCHDWDTVTRFARSGGKIVHAPHILYQWRMHGQSSSNSGALNEGSLRSVQYVLQGNIDSTGNPKLYRVAPFPKWRGAEQWAILRNETAPTKTTIMVLGLTDETPTVPAPLAQIARDHNLSIVTVPAAFSAEGRKDFVLKLHEVKSPLTLIISEGCLPDSAEGFWEAMRLLEMHDNAVAAGGRIYNRNGIITSVGVSANEGEIGVQSWRGTTIDHAGAYALALKPQRAVSVPTEYCMVKTPFLKGMHDQGSSRFDMADLGSSIGKAAARDGKLICYSPLIQGREIVALALFHGASRA